MVTTDPELDDSNSLLRYLLYSAEFRTEGLIYASSGAHWKGDGRGTTFSSPTGEYKRFGLNLCPCTSWRWAPGERFIDADIDVYEQAYPNLKVHDPDFPSPADLRSKVRVGNVEFEGDISKDSEGSNLIRALLLDDRPGPVYLLAWAGGSTIARALKSIEDQYAATPKWPAIRDKVCAKAIIQSFGDQDGTYAAYIRPHWPKLAFRQMATQTFGYGARKAVLPEDQMYLSAAWLWANISSRGPMGAHYRVWGDGRQMVKGDIFDHFGFSGLSEAELKAMGYVVWTPVEEKGSWISEGDTSTFMNLLDNGLRGYEDASWGGWGGRDGVDKGPNGPDLNYASARFFAAAQRDLASRFQWAITRRFKGANHPPVVAVRGPLERTARPGETVRLEGSATDPDGDQVRLKWWQYEEAGSYGGPVALREADGASAELRVPVDARPGQTIHVILEATDSGTPALTRYERVILRVAG